MSKYTPMILLAALVLSILVAIFYNQLIQMDTLTLAIGIAFALLLLLVFLYTLGRRLLYGERIDWSQILLIRFRPFLSPLNTDDFHHSVKSEQLKPFTFPEQKESQDVE